jgi:site-specific recombinase XerC
MKNELDKTPEKVSDNRELKLYRRKTYHDDLIVLSLGKNDSEEDTVTNIDLNDVKISIATVSKPGTGEQSISETLLAIEMDADE